MSAPIPAPASATSQVLPPVNVIYEDADTGDTMMITVKTTLKDRSAYEVHAHKSGWPTKNPMQNATFLWFGFLAWSALRREPEAPAQLRTAGPDAFFDAVIDVVPSDDEGEATIVDPTLEAPGSASD